MLVALHALVYSDDPDATRAFFRDVLEWPSLETPEGSGWLIFRTGASELGVHPTSYTWEGEEHTHPRHHQVSLMCDDIETTIAELEAKGASFTGPVEDLGFGLCTNVEVPGADPILLYEPTHPTAYDL
jgi:predicted enzyme related to lactoylglutathione lyase